MPIQQLTVENFKGIAKQTSFEIRPITVFLGANSSGKSSVIHALATLGQTIKLGNSAPALVLDDDFAQVHLGRFIEIAHSKNYKDAMSLGVDIVHRPFDIVSPEGKKINLSGKIKAEYSFKSTLRTQEVYVDSVLIQLDDIKIEIKKTGKGYTANFDGLAEKFKVPVERHKNFFFRTDAIDFKKPHTVTAFMTLESCQQALEELLRTVLYLGPFRQAPLRRYPFRGTTAVEVGAQGEATITMLANEHIQQQARSHLKEINLWLSHLGLATAIDLSRVGSSDLFDVKLTLPDGDKLPIADLGYGLSQVLPVLTQCSYAPESSTLLFEQPELHLHQGASRRLAKVFCDTAAKKNANVVIETHSAELINEFFQTVKAGTLRVSDLAIYAVSREDGESKYDRLRLDFDGRHLEVEQRQWAHLLDV